MTSKGCQAQKSPRIILAPDSFKECLSAADVCRALRRGIENRRPDVEVLAAPMADGGEGSLNALNPSAEGSIISLDVSHPLGAHRDRVRVDYLLATDGHLAVIESARACGLQLIPPTQRDPHVATTRGVGELLRHAVGRGVRHIIVAVGGSATVDGGTGLARALGFRFLDEQGRDLPEGGLALARLARIAGPAPANRHHWQALQKIRVQVACDVDNPLVGANGAAEVYAEQKGQPGKVDIAGLALGLQQLARVVHDQFGVDLAGMPHGGAAGGLAAGLSYFAGADLRRGFELIRSRIGLREKIASADLVITGEGRTDHQTLHQKVCQGVAELARDLSVPCALVSGSIAEDFDAPQLLGVTQAVSLMQPGESVEDSKAATAERLRKAGEDLADRLDELSRPPNRTS
ncbi:MAG: glycerate kinase [Acidobacteriota bacterium]